MNELEKAYMTLQNACGIEEGDTVKVLRKAIDQQWGWPTVWTESMDSCVGKTGIVKQVIENGVGVSIDGDWWNYPFFVLEKIPKPHWRDTVSSENPVLCYVRDSKHTEWGAHGPYSITGYTDCTFKYRTAAGGWMQAKRVPKSMIESMLKAYDVTAEDE